MYSISTLKNNEANRMYYMFYDVSPVEQIQVK